MDIALARVTALSGLPGCPDPMDANPVFVYTCETAEHAVKVARKVCRELTRLQYRNVKGFRRDNVLTFTFDVPGATLPESWLSREQRERNRIPVAQRIAQDVARAVCDQVTQGLPPAIQALFDRKRQGFTVNRTTEVVGHRATVRFFFDGLQKRCFTLLLILTDGELIIRQLRPASPVLRFRADTVSRIPLADPDCIEVASQLLLTVIRECLQEARIGITDDLKQLRTQRTQIIKLLDRAQLPQLINPDDNPQTITPREDDPWPHPGTT